VTSESALIGISDVASVVRSKNAGPFQLTLDVLFADAAIYRRVRDSGSITPALIAGLYSLDERSVKLLWFDPAAALKINLPRRHSSASFRDTDVYGAQQHAPLLSLAFPAEVATEGSAE
jgi:hypothetical protein